jgi:hypothetical protein
MPAAARRSNHRVYNRFGHIPKLALLFYADRLVGLILPSPETALFKP